ncbi:hypothetical protein HKCCE2091_18195 [Rhodobacterales bacterium HKCCE2091]|nr:hypothetical protein [Rhodobacterales bacterium HKCCE2091]
MQRINVDVVLGLVVLACALVAVVIWIPNDTGSGIVESVRGRYSIGDALAPTVAFAILGLAGAALLIESRRKKPTGQLSSRNLAFIGFMLLIYLAAILVMRWTGPALASIAAEGSYRELRDTLPWKYLGYVAGGTLMVSVMVSLVERQFTGKALLIGVLASLLMAMFYDLPFDDLLLPPNGDV